MITRYAPKLVNYYTRLGFEPVRVVGNGENGFMSDLPDLLVWGGAGTRMNAQVDELLERWSHVIRRSARPRGGAGGEVGSHRR